MTEDRDKDKPSLEPPSWFGRRPKKAVAPPAPAPSEPVVAPAPVVARDPEPASAPEPAPVAGPAPEPAPVAVPVAPVEDDSPTTILDEPATVSVDTLEPHQPVSEEPVAEEPVAEEPPAPPRERREPWLRGRPAAVLAGLLVGALVVGATAASLRLCTAVKGTSSCGNPGFFLLVAILVVAVLVGSALLRLAQVPDATSTSFLAVGLMSVFALLFLVGRLFEWWMIIVIPLVSVTTFLLSHWVTTTYIEPARD